MIKELFDGSLTKKMSPPYTFRYKVKYTLVYSIYNMLSKIAYTIKYNFYNILCKLNIYARYTHRDITTDVLAQDTFPEIITPTLAVTPQISLVEKVYTFSDYFYRKTSKGARKVKWTLSDEYSEHYSIRVNCSNMVGVRTPDSTFRYFCTNQAKILVNKNRGEIQPMGVNLNIVKYEMNLTPIRNLVLEVQIPSPEELLEGELNAKIEWFVEMYKRRVEKITYMDIVRRNDE